MSTKSFVCQFCDKPYNSRSGKSTHIKYYCQNNPNRIDEPKRDRRKIKDTQNTQDINESKEDKSIAMVLQYVVKILAILTEKASGGNSLSINNNTGHISTGNNITNNISINNFGKETLEHSSSEFLSHCVDTNSSGIIELIEKIYLDPNVPQNRTIKIKSRKKNIMQALENGEWVQKDKNTL
jgi:hypothetical protein